MEITFYKKSPVPEQPPITHRKPSLRPKSKRFSQFADFKGLTLREYFARWEKPSERDSDGRCEKDNCSFEALPGNKIGKMGLGAIREGTKGRNVTEMSEKQFQRHRQRLKSRSKLLQEKDSRDEVCRVVVQEGILPNCRTNPSELVINNSFNLLQRFRRRQKATARQVSCTHQGDPFLLNSTKPIHHLSPHKVSPRGSREWQKPRVFSYYPQMQGGKGKPGKLREILQKLVSSSTPELQGDFGKCLNLLSRK